VSGRRWAGRSDGSADSSVLQVSLHGLDEATGQAPEARPPAGRTRMGRDELGDGHLSRKASLTSLGELNLSAERFFSVSSTLSSAPFFLAVSSSVCLSVG
jgi:hypothetical protein